MSKKIWKIPVDWEVCSVVEIKAETLEDAVRLFDDTIDDLPLPTEADYIDGSFKRGMQDSKKETIEYYKLFNKED